MRSTQLSSWCAWRVAVVSTCVAVGQAALLRPGKVANHAKTPYNNETFSKWLSVDNFTDPSDITAIVTFAGLKNQEYIDAATMLGFSLQRHVPGYPMVALAIEGMKSHYQEQLNKAGWQLVFVENWEGEHCSVGCDLEFMGRWHDSFEKINTFRLPFGRVLFMDADTYVFSERLREVLTSTQLPEGHIAMSPDGCKSEYNSGVMLFRPSVDVFRSMLAMIGKRSREQILDQTIINNIYAGKIVELDREFNCVDTLGVQPGQRTECHKRCRNVVVAHFTGHPKPTAAKRRLLELVRRPGGPELAVRNTNFGSSGKWSQYYCDIREHRQGMSKELQHGLHMTGSCCHIPFKKGDEETCKECPASFIVKGTKGNEAPAELGMEGVYMKSTIKPTAFHGMMSIYVKPNTDTGKYLYLYYVKKQLLWMIGLNYTTNAPYAYAGKTALCPRDASAWHFSVSGVWTIKPLLVNPYHESGRSGANETQPMLFDVKSNQWVPDVPDSTATTSDQENWD